MVRYLSWPRHVSPADTHAFVEFSNNEWQCKLVGPYLIELLAGGSLIGSTGVAVESVTRASVGYVLARHAWGHGYATEALQAMVELAAQLALQELYALCHPDNRASCRVLEKGGFERTPALDENVVFPNQKVTIVTAAYYLKRMDQAHLWDSAINP